MSIKSSLRINQSPIKTISIVTLLLSITLRETFEIAARDEKVSRLQRRKTALRSPASAAKANRRSVFYAERLSIGAGCSAFCNAAFLKPPEQIKADDQTARRENQIAGIVAAGGGRLRVGKSQRERVFSDVSLNPETD